jgi:hypothetical protein
MVTVFSGVDGITMFKIRPTGAKIAFDDFCHNIVELLEQVLNPDSRLPGTTHSALHFDIAPVHKTEKFARNVMSASSADLNIRFIPRFSVYMIFSSSAISMTRCNSWYVALWMSFRKR